ncbi:ABC transporter ATP-binding protein [Paroceanicella profunda]|uniref:ABC transporter ATP-binding protein n=1 Tax=Paroceanicella profunda TaxID=2579971 RepID=A0A5B8FV13_9RHOB|nr:dipeptide ABC transporter ATP-binding protein [Paroceanicella profunda]QDL90910.1 ABC transporter ATP-binding protein [Paroceanicella profunda]
MSALVQVSGLNVSIGALPVLRDVTFDVAPGEILGLIGESGSGKSMTALALMDLLPPRARRSGSLRLEGTELNALTERQMCGVRGRDIAMVFQEPMTALNPVLCIGDQVAETVRQHTGATRAEARARAAEVLARVGLPQETFPLSRYPHELSGGQRQRVVIAMAIALRPKLLICDEPTTALDVTTQARIVALLRRLVAEDGMGMIFITHDLGLVAGLADHICIMRGGEIVERGPTGPLFREMRHPYTRALAEASVHVPARPGGGARARGAPGPGGMADRPQGPGVQAEDAREPDTRAHGAPGPGVRTTVAQVPDARLRGAEADGAQGPETPLLEIRNLVRAYPAPRGLGPRRPAMRAVDGVSFTLRRGENLGLVGESGCGKSTLTRALLGLEATQGGSIRFDGAEIPAGAPVPRAVRQRMQVVFQDPYGSFNPRHRVERLVAEPFHLLDAPPRGRERRARVAEALESVGLSAADASKYIHEFSGGQRQRIAIARALVIRPDLIILDEAVSALDVSIRAQVLDLLAALSGRFGMSYLFISHDLGVVRAITDRVMVMRAGRIVEAGETEALFHNPQHPYTRELLAATPSLAAALA